MTIRSLIWTLIAGTGLLASILFGALGMSVAMNWHAAGFLVLLFVLSMVIRRRFAAAAKLCEAFTQILAFCQVGGYLTYAVMAASPFPLADGLLSHADMALGFDWLAWFTWLKNHPELHWVLATAYRSIPPQAAVLLVYFAYVDAKRVDEMIIATILAIFLIIPGEYFLPAVGSWTQHGIGMVEPWRGEILALRSHMLTRVVTTQGVIAFPSFHTALAVLLVNMARGRKLFLPILCLNLVLIASVMTEGAHYGVDMLSGLAVAWVAIAASRSAMNWCGNGRPMMAGWAVSSRTLIQLIAVKTQW